MKLLQRAEPCRSLRFVPASIVAISLAVLAGCGGTSGEEQASDDSSKFPDIRVIQRDPPPSLPRDAPCEESQFRQVGTTSDDNAALVSRHVYCYILLPQSEAVQVDLMRNANDTGWEFYNPSAGRPPGTFTVGTLVLATRFEANKSTLDGPIKWHAYSVEVKSFIPSNDFPLKGQPLTLSVKPRMNCTAGTINGIGVDGHGCDYSGLQSVTVNLSNGSRSPRSTFGATFSWRPPTDASQDYASFHFYPQAHEYKVNQTPRPTEYGPFSIPVAGYQGRMVPQNLRCDRNIISEGSMGCVFPAAAPVFVLNAMDTSVTEAALHIYSAQRTLSPGQSQLSPGRFRLKPGTQAVVLDPNEPQYYGLQRAPDKATTDANRAASCTSTASLYASRPFQGSQSCSARTSPNCQCDEYPFAATTNGGSISPDATSVRGILGTHNETAGGRLGNFYVTERVLRKNSGYDPFWVDIKGVQ